jgi:hypothetical protein
LCEGVAPIGKWQLVLAPAEDAMNKNNLAGFETKRHCRVILVGRIGPEYSQSMVTRFGMIMHRWVEE